MSYYSRVLSKDPEFPAFEDLLAKIAVDHPEFKLAIESGDEDEWESLLLSSLDNVEVALLERNPVTPGSVGEDMIADFIEDTREAQPESAAVWLAEYLAEVQTIYAIQHLQGAFTEDGSNALHALRSMLWERGDAIIQADNEGFTNEDGYHILWQFSDSVVGPWNMGILQDETWYHFTMDLGDPDHREAFLSGEVPFDITPIQGSGAGL
jgi:hypothetical protein